jgi:tetratricopeptide (TPR) repeat protein/TolB-like protein
VLLEGAVVAGRYRIERQIGAGGMGIVYRARDQELDTDVALKVLRPSLGSTAQLIDRLRRELLLARAVTHRNVVRIHDIGESGGLPFLSMSLIEGRSLADVLLQEGPLALDRAVRIVRQLAEALEQAHAAGILHRDIKPGNILLADDDTAYLADFGLARSLQGDERTGTGGVVGTLDYLSPEQAAGDALDARSDIYTLGIVLFEMLTGQLPFRADSPTETLALHITARARDISETGVRVPPHVRGVLGRCLQRSPSRRYASTRELIATTRPPEQAAAGHAARGVLRFLRCSAAASASPRHGAWMARSTPAVRDAPLDVAVLPLADDTGDQSLAWASNGLAEMLAADLAEAPQLRVIDSARVARTLRDVGLDAGGQDPATRQRIAELPGVERLVVGSLRRAGTTLRVDLRLVSVHSHGRVGAPVLAAETTNAGSLFGVVATLSDRLRQQLGAARRPADPTPEPQTASLEAAEAYRKGRERLEIGDSVGAAPAFERAVAADGGYAAAHLGLSEAYQALGYHDKALASAERAAAALGAAADTRLAWRTRARLALLRGDDAEAERAYAELVRRYPNDTEALLERAAAQQKQGAVATAVATLRQLTALDSSDPRAWFLLGKSMILVGDARQAVTDPLVRALALMTQLGNLQGRGDVLNAMGVAHQRLGELDAATARYAEAAALRQQAGDERGAAVSQANRAGILVTQGRFAEAEPDLRAARDVYRRIGDRAGLASAWSGWGALHEGRGEYGDALGAYREALRIRRELGNQQQIGQSYDDVGYAYFLQGDHDNAQVYWRQGA